MWRHSRFRTRRRLLRDRTASRTSFVPDFYEVRNAAPLSSFALPFGRCPVLRNFWERRILTFALPLPVLANALSKTFCAFWSLCKPPIHIQMVACVRSVVACPAEEIPRAEVYDLEDAGLLVDRKIAGVERRSAPLSSFALRMRV